jgi:hypothetical protein
MIQHIDIYRSAKLLIDQHGEEAAIFAGMQADESFEQGDLDCPNLYDDGQSRYRSGILQDGAWLALAGYSYWRDLLWLAWKKHR